ncbi:hypothetical protein HETIRDRAFT_102197 [Heterobasidion irregulare TC 32-1]|uniref:Uncharacterized protein n=1 Tax=Heterobasidion irregulare (strain TC 32-1) TaxID=747525 RepID=W4K751_HETIT|nr:uncharacterized protein HETIRDRAFT_102197 [Heterobasidion irregulare TC 32-1]ETW81170.1 hypothetical protein HETIRDRAFT_102197 [Heterobasidion irregulare TC 32-1]
MNRIESARLRCIAMRLLNGPAGAASSRPGGYKQAQITRARETRAVCRSLLMGGTRRARIELRSLCVRAEKSPDGDEGTQTAARGVHARARIKRR